VRRWPAAAEVLEQAGRWAALQRSGLLISSRWVFTASRKPGGYGSYGRGTAGVGSDLDLLLILKRCEEPIWDRLHCWDTGSLPLACDLLVYSFEEWRSLPQPGRLCSSWCIPSAERSRRLPDSAGSRPAG
jgi:hypothetical protein